ncbi:MAG: trypsin-like serine protease [Sandaracinaceae bacterium]|nr:trypsin-like serine protease [Sandaracinaceae bacterium]
MIRTRVALASLLILLGCQREAAGGVRAAIGGGAADTTTDAVVYVEPTGGEPCSGAIVGPRHVLTFKGCVYDGTRARAASELAIARGPVVDATSPRATVAEILATAELPRAMGDTNDLVVLVTTEALGVTPLPLGAASPRADDALRLYGYGEDAGGTAGVRRGGAATVELVREGVIVTGGPAGVCDGDLGGPALDASGAVVGVAMFAFPIEGGELTCPSGSGLASVSTYLAFLRDALGIVAPDAGVEAPDAGADDAGTDAGAEEPADAASAPADAGVDAGAMNGGGDSGCAAASAAPGRTRLPIPLLALLALVAIAWRTARRP